MLHFIFISQFSGLHNTMCVCVCECRMCDVYSLKSKHSHTVWIYVRRCCTAVLFHLHSSLSVDFAQLYCYCCCSIYGSQWHFWISADYKHIHDIHTNIHTRAPSIHTCLFVLCTHTTYGHTNTPHFWMKFILQGRRMSTVEKLFKNSIRFQWIAIILMTRLKILNQAYICNRNRFCFLLHCIDKYSVFFLNIKWNDAHNTNKHIFGAYYMFRKLSIFFLVPFGRLLDPNASLPFSINYHIKCACVRVYRMMLYLAAQNFFFCLASLLDFYFAARWRSFLYRPLPRFLALVLTFTLRSP